MKMIISLLFGVLAMSVNAAPFPSPSDWRDENIYQVITDRFFDGDPSNNTANPDGTYSPSNSGALHGGDFKGIQQKLDYIKSLGATAIWISPIVRNTSAQYHGYSGWDFTVVDPHWGTLTDLTNMIAAAHARGIKVVLDVVVNHGGDLVNSSQSGYSTTFRYPPSGYTMRFRSSSKQFKPPFNTNSVAPTISSIVHTNGLIFNFSDNTQVELGELSGLDDFCTETTHIRTNMANVYKSWIQQADFDGFRIDTVKHVDHGNAGFWNYWCPQIHNFATSLGKSNFFMFGEVYDGSDQKCGGYTGTMLSTNFALDATLDYPLYFMVNGIFATATAQNQQIEGHYNAIPTYYDPAAQYRLVTFLDNHDQARFLSSGNANNNTNRLGVALAFLYTARGIPCLYYGSEQAFNGTGDPNNREDMFDGAFEQTASLGDNFNETHPLFQFIASLNNYRRLYPSLRRGAHNNLWNSSSGPGLFAYSRTLSNEEVFVVFNTASSSQTLPNRPTTYPAGTVLVNLLNTNETITIDSSPSTPAITVPSTSIKVFIAQSLVKPLDPVVISQSPTHAVTNVSNTAQIVLRFSKPMDTNSVQSAFTIQPPTAGIFSWSALRDTMTFTANGGGFPLLSTNVVRIGTNAMDAVAGKTFYAPFETYFVTRATATADSSPPGISISNPINGAVVSGQLAVSGSATDNVGVAKVEFQLDNGGWLLATGTTLWNFPFNTVNFLNGVHTLFARATDTSGNVSTNAAVSVKFFNVPGGYIQRLSAGNPSNVIDCAANTWLADQAYSFGSFGYVAGTNAYIANTISNVCAAEYPLYQRERAGTFSYAFDCPAGIYETTLLEAETLWTDAGQRVFNVFIESQQVLTNFDIYAAAGDMNTAVAQVFTTAVANAHLEIQFSPLVDDARASGIQVKKIADVDTDADEIPDWWMLAYFNHPTGQSADQSRATDNPDGDSLNNLQEYLAGTNPLVFDSLPAAPSALTATNVFENQIALTWQDNSTNELAFIIQRAPSASGPWAPVASVASNVTSLTDCALAGDTTYFYQVVATNAVGASSPSNVASATTPATNNVIAFDRASNYAGSWTNGSNGGTGFGPWTLVQGISNGSSNGFFLGSSGNNGFGGGVNIDSCGLSFGLFANNTGNAVAYRTFGGTPLSVGESLRWRLDNGWIDNGNSVGTVLRTGNATNTVNDYNTGARFQFYFLGGTNNYFVVDAAGTNDTGVGYTSEALELEFTLTGTNTYSLHIARLANATATNITGTLGGTGGASLDSLAVYNRNAGAGGQYDVFFNSFRRINVNLDSVGDGIPNWWRALYFSSVDPTGTTTNGLSCASCDPDGDGLTNLKEFLTDTTPNDPNSAFRITNINVVSNNLAITWTTRPSKTNQLERSSELGTSASWGNVGGLTIGTGSPATQPDPGAATNPPAFYRVRLVP